SRIVSLTWPGTKSSASAMTGSRNTYVPGSTAFSSSMTGLEIGKVLNALALEFLFPLQNRDDLANELRQPGHRVRPQGKRQRPQTDWCPVEATPPEPSQLCGRSGRKGRGLSPGRCGGSRR